LHHFEINSLTTEIIMVLWSFGFGGY